MNLTIRILLGMLLGMVIGILLKYLPIPESINQFIVTYIFQTGGDLFLNILKMLVVPVVLVSLICGSSSLDARKLGRVGGKTLLLYILTTILAITLAITVASLFGIGKGVNLQATSSFQNGAIPNIKQVITNIVPSNPFKALVDGEMLQIILFALLFGVAVSLSGKPGERLIAVFQDANHVIMRLIIMIMQVAPFGVFFLVAALFSRFGFGLIDDLLGYFLTVLVVLLLQLLGVYTSMLRLLGRLNPLLFLRNMYSAMIFAFSVSSSNASIPVVLKTVEDRLGVKNSIASFVIPLGATINMDGTAIMQGVATVFIAHAYNIHIGIVGYLTVVVTATLASIGTAGVPSVGLITLAMVLRQVGLPIEGIGLIIGVDRLLDMMRTSVNIAGDAMVACLVGKSEQAVDMKKWRSVHEN